MMVLRLVLAIFIQLTEVELSSGLASQSLFSYSWFLEGPIEYSL